MAFLDELHAVGCDLYLHQQGNPSRPYPGNERRELPAQSEPETEDRKRLLTDPTTGTKGPPVGPQEPPARAAASALWGALRSARGSLLWTTGIPRKASIPSNRVAPFYSAPPAPNCSAVDNRRGT
ncbi:MAG: hypothetical protein QGI13_08755 [Rhodospirillales bacterium]|nr:hypothetical protein [Rhodospirillales bacterium]